MRQAYYVTGLAVRMAFRYKSLRAFHIAHTFAFYSLCEKLRHSLRFIQTRLFGFSQNIVQNHKFTHIYAIEIDDSVLGCFWAGCFSEG